MGFVPAAHAAPTPQQLCESAMELAPAKYAQCRLNAESKYSKTLDAAKRTAAYAKCSTNLGAAFSKATGKYGGACGATETSSAFDAYLKQCSDDATAAAAGATLPDYVGELASSNADLTASYGSTNVLDGTAATTFLAALNAGGGFAGHTDWRLPNRKELESLTNLEIAVG